ncbi:hypothetical protein SNEBB_008299 [Seison nebaliae]|nr:hypothetical protein SNEBB_008299 [Seison nebaliae]
MSNVITPQGSERRTKSRIVYDKVVRKLKKLRKSLVLVRTGMKKKFSPKRRVAPVRTISASSCGLTSEVTSQEMEDAKEWTRDDEISVKKVSRILEYWNMQLIGLKGSLSSYVARRANSEIERNNQ